MRRNAVWSGIAAAGAAMIVAGAVAGPSEAIRQNEADAYAALWTIYTAEEAYRAGNRGGAYATLGELGATVPPLLDRELAGGRKRGYLFHLTAAPGGGPGYQVSAEPAEPGVTGNRTFSLERERDSAAVEIVGAEDRARRRFARNESSAIASLKTLVTAEEQFKTTAGGAVYGSLSAMSGMNPPYIGADLGRGVKSGYSFVLTVGTPADSNYVVEANPLAPGQSGGRRFFVDSSGVVRFHEEHRASSGDSAIE